MVQVVSVHEGKVERRPDALAVEEPLEIRLVLPGRPAPLGLSVTMRTPGHDFELVAGFLLAEGVIAESADMVAMRYCTDPGMEQHYNVVSVDLRPGLPFDPARLVRHGFTTSSCGVCGKASLEAIAAQGLRPPGAAPPLAPAVITALPEALRRRQAVFERTGGLHAAALFDAAGGIIAMREDVGRHNAVDKVIGSQLLAGRVPQPAAILLVSGRASFELVQKALTAGIGAVCAISAPSSLAVELAQAFELLLIGFLRGSAFNVYAGAHRLTTLAQ